MNQKIEDKSIEKIVYSFLIRLTPEEAAPLLSLVNDAMKMALIEKILKQKEAPSGAVVEFEMKISNNPDRETRREEETMSEQEEGDPEEKIPWGLCFSGKIIDSMKEYLKSVFLEKFQKKHPKIFEDLRPFVFLFKDFLFFEDKMLQRALIGVDIKNLALALSDSEEELKEKFSNNLSKFNQKVLLDELAYLKAVPDELPAEAREKLMPLLKLQK
jgi:flagellar motor switch protein FliG